MCLCVLALPPLHPYLFTLHSPSEEVYLKLWIQNWPNSFYRLDDLPSIYPYGRNQP